MVTTIRSFRSNDKEDLINIFRMNIPKYFAEHELQKFDEYLDEHPSTYLVIINDDIIVGSAGYLVEQVRNEAQITWIFIHPLFHGKGLGKKLVLRCIELINEGGKNRKITVRTSQHACKFFEKFGMETIKTIDNYWGSGLHLYYMVKSI